MRKERPRPANVEDISVLLQEVEKTVKKMKIRKAPGENNIKLLKKEGVPVYKQLARIFSDCM